MKNNALRSEIRQGGMTAGTNELVVFPSALGCRELSTQVFRVRQNERIPQHSHL